jgi:mRNA-degrading endonuclease toxin of MazEF toxin-antitoxin module
MRAGDVYWVDFRRRGGREQEGRRPAIVLQGASASASLPTALCVPLTSQLDALRFPGTLLVEAEASNGLRRASVALVFQLTAIDRRQISVRLGNVSASVMSGIWQALDELGERSVSSGQS